MSSHILTMPESDRLMGALDATWPAKAVLDLAGWRLRAGAGGGKRVSAASPLGPGGIIADAETAMREQGEVPLFRLVPSDAAQDAALAARSYARIDPVVLYVAPARTLAGEGPHLSAVYRAQTAPAIMEEIWAAGGIGPGRLAVMDRVQGPSARLLSRTDDTASGVAFVAVDGEVAMVHAIEVVAKHRRHGAGGLLIQGAARFALDAGARWLALAVGEANAPARALYDRLGMAEAGRYHYRIAPEAKETT